MDRVTAVHRDLRRQALARDEKPDDTGRPQRLVDDPRPRFNGVPVAHDALRWDFRGVQRVFGERG